MNLKKIALVACFGLILGLISAQTAIEKALRSGDAGYITSQMASQVEVCVPNDEGTYPKSKASALLESFFKSHTVTGYENMHSGESRDKTSNFTIGKLTTNKGSFRVYVLYVNEGGAEVVQEICIEK